MMEIAKFVFSLGLRLVIIGALSYESLSRALVSWRVQTPGVLLLRRQPTSQPLFSPDRSRVHLFCILLDVFTAQKQVDDVWVYVCWNIVGQSIG